jgi:phosphopantetheine adenylyltransferase
MKQIVFTTGRFNPPTRGHVKLIRAAKTLARTTGADTRFYVTRTHDKKTNPLSLDEKLGFLKSFFPQTEFHSCVNAFTACREMAEAGYERAVLVVGADRDGELIAGLRRYIDHPDSSKSIGLKEIDTFVVEREDSDFSASKARHLATVGDLEGFTNMVPQASTRTIQELFDAVRRGLGANDAIHERYQDRN